MLIDLPCSSRPAAAREFVSNEDPSSCKLLCMTSCLLGLGSNLGDRESTIRAALTEIDSLPDVLLSRQSSLGESPPIGGPSQQENFLNAAAVIETTIPPLRLLDELRTIEIRNGRQPTERWGPRTIDIDLLLYGNEVMETEMLTLPHPRLAFRRFVLEPAAEVAPKMLHPIIGWPVERLLLHLDAASDQLAILSTSKELRSQVVDIVGPKIGARDTEPPNFSTAEHHWPREWTTWLSIPAIPTSKPVTGSQTSLPYAAAAFPKLSILLDDPVAKPGNKLQWSSLVRQPGRGPMLRLQTIIPSQFEAEITASVAAVWPDLGR
jgi:2-amino-4-hydroxy-6-hydroxymethyldihydropteridine diphosphokinase